MSEHGWVHCQCYDCWTFEHPDGIPVRIRDSEEDKCCYCGRLTIEGIYVRQNPNSEFLLCREENDV